MADTEEPQYTTLAERIAALNKNKTFAANGLSPSPSPAAKRRPPPPPPASSNKIQTAAAEANGIKTNGSNAAAPPVPSRPTKGNPPTLPRRDTQKSTEEKTDNESGDAKPSLPPRMPSSLQTQAPPPPLPQRRVSIQPNGATTVRRNSASSEVSQNSTQSSQSLGQTSQSMTSQSSSGNDQRKQPPINTTASTTSNNSPSLPPRLPSRPAAKSTDSSAAAPARPRIMGFNSGSGSRPSANTQRKSTHDQAPSVPARPPENDTPPPVPTASRPTAAQIDAFAARGSSAPQDSNECFTCRDWSGPDGVATQYPRQSLPGRDAVGYLAHHLCSPFPSYNDKARAIFTWFHYNIMYDVDSFFNDNVRGQTADETIRSGLAVCQGYAETYKAIAVRAGLECIVIGGHGKGFGYTPLRRGERPPPAKPDGHAWNAVRIDGGIWKLLDACWGAGHLCNNRYKQEFSPKEFTLTNSEFGARHFPKDPQHQLREDGRTLTWEEYYRGKADGPPVTVYGNTGQEGISETSIEPASKEIKVYSGKVIRFQFSKVCPHWSSEKNGLGKPPLLLLRIHGVDGRKDDTIPIQTDGYWHWVDVNAHDLGAPGQKIELAQVASWDGGDGRGLTEQEYFSRRNRVKRSYGFLCQWELV